MQNRPPFPAQWHKKLLDLVSDLDNPLLVQLATLSGKTYPESRTVILRFVPNLEKLYVSRLRNRGHLRDVCFTTASYWRCARSSRSEKVRFRSSPSSEGRERLSTTRLRDYVANVEQVAAKMAVPPVLVGTPMGGVVVQHYMQQRPTLAAVLMASGPPHGMLPSSLWMLATNPLLVQDMALLSVVDPGMATVDRTRRALFRPDTSD